MHVLYLNQLFSDLRGISNPRSYEFSKLLLERGHRITMITGTNAYSAQKRQTGFRVIKQDTDGIDTRVIPVYYSQTMPFWRRKIAFAVFSARAALTACSIQQADVIYATSPPLTIALSGIAASLYARKPFVFEVRDLWPHAPIHMGALRSPLARTAAHGLADLAYFFADHVVALSPGQSEGIQQRGVSAKRISIIPNSSDVEFMRDNSDDGNDFRARHPELQQRRILLHAGAFGKVNRLEYAVQLAQALQLMNSSLAIVLVGQGSEKQRIVEMATQRHVLGKNLFIYDAVTRGYLPKVISAAWALATFVAPIPLLWTNSANKFFDAFAAGKPAVINYHGWHEDLLKETGAGLVLPTHDIEKAARILVDKLDDKRWYEQASQASRSLGETQFNRRILVNELERVLLDAISERSCRKERLIARGKQGINRYVKALTNRIHKGIHADTKAS